MMSLSAPASSLIQFGHEEGGVAGCQSLMTSSAAAASLTCHHLSETPAVTPPCHHQSAQRSMLSVSSGSAGMLLWSKPLMFCGLCFSDADWKWFSTGSKQTNNTLHAKTLSCASSTSYAEQSSIQTKALQPTEAFQWDQVASALNSSRNWAELPL